MSGLDVILCHQAWHAIPRACKVVFFLEFGGHPGAVEGLEMPILMNYFDLGSYG